MSEELGVWAADLLIKQAWTALEETRYQEAMAAASRAVKAAEQLDDPVILVRALGAEAATSVTLGDYPAALACYTQILGLAQDSSTNDRLDDPRAAYEIASAHWNWVQSARFMTGIPVRALFEVLNAADRWLTASGHREWRSAILVQRARIHQRVEEMDAAVTAAEEALAVKLQHPGDAHYTLNCHRYVLGDVLRDAGRAAEAAPHYQAIVDDPNAESMDRRVAHEGLAWCALAADDPAAARREARTAVLMAESQGDDALCDSLEVLAKAFQADGDLEEARQAAARSLELAGRMGGHYRLYSVVQLTVDVALDQHDLDTARQLLAELDEHAAAIDASIGSTTLTHETAQRRQRLAELEEAAP